MFCIWIWPGMLLCWKSPLCASTFQLEKLKYSKWELLIFAHACDFSTKPILFFFIKYQKFNINFQSEFSWMCCKLYPSFWRISAEKEDLSWLSDAVRDHNFNLDSRSSLLSLLTWTLHSHQRDACLKIPQKRGCRVYVYTKKITR